MNTLPSAPTVTKRVPSGENGFMNKSSVVFDALSEFVRDSGVEVDCSIFGGRDGFERAHGSYGDVVNGFRVASNFAHGRSGIVEECVTESAINVTVQSLVEWAGIALRDDNSLTCPALLLLQ